jgi:hypothetical protein
LRDRLGDPDSTDMFPTGATLMRYALRWKCGCNADGVSGMFACRPCARHAADLRTA